MNIAIAFASSSGQISGVQRHALNLARCLLTRPEIAHVHLIAAPWQLEFVLDLLSDLLPGIAPPAEGRLHLHAAPIGNSALSRNRWFYRQLPSLARELNVDLVHLAYPVPVAKNAYPCPTVVTLHDLYPYDIPENFGFPKVLFNRAVLRQCLRRVDSIACVSQSTLHRLSELDPRLSARATAVCNSVEALELAPTFQNALWQLEHHPFLLCVAQHRRNKNILLALRTFELLQRHPRRAQAPAQNPAATRLVLVGIPGPETPAIERFISDAGLRSSILLLHGISDQQLQWCYRNSVALLAPSALEGFGLPVAEALLAGCPVVCSDIPAFREVGGDRCHYVPLTPHAEEAFASAIEAIRTQPAPAPLPLPELSAPVIGEACVQLYSSLLRSGRATAEAPSPALLPAREGRPVG